MKTFFIIVGCVVAIAGILVYQFGFQKIRIEPGTVSPEAMTKSCNDSLYKDLPAAEAAQMKTACECMMQANAAALNKKDGVTAIEWMTEVQKQSAACMAKAGISTQ